MTLDKLLQLIDEDVVIRKRVAKADYQAGYNDCEQGQYDQWYRNHRKDNGLAYDIGWNSANEIFKNNNVKIIVCLDKHIFRY